MITVALVVEDDALVRMMTVSTLEDAGFDLIELGSADEAKAALEAGPRRVDIVVTDIRMPGKIDGLGLAQWITTTLPNIRVIVTSGFAERIRERLPETVEFLPKPWTSASLLKLVDQR